MARRGIILLWLLKTSVVCVVVVSGTTPGSLQSPGSPPEPECKPGETWDYGPCLYCFCDDVPPRKICVYTDCDFDPLPCPYPVHEPGNCCPTCPDGWSESPGTPQSPRTPGSPGSPSGSVAPKCADGGATYEPGQSWLPDTCTLCLCDSFGSGEFRCSHTDCFQTPPCWDPIVEPGNCCATCPNGENCRSGDTVIPNGENVTLDTGEICWCKNLYLDGLEVVCTASNTTSIAPDTTSHQPPTPPATQSWTPTPTTENPDQETSSPSAENRRKDRKPKKDKFRGPKRNRREPKKQKQ